MRQNRALVNQSENVPKNKVGKQHTYTFPQTWFYFLFHLQKCLDVPQPDEIMVSNEHWQVFMKDTVRKQLFSIFLCNIFVPNQGNRLSFERPRREVGRRSSQHPGHGRRVRNTFYTILLTWDKENHVFQQVNGFTSPWRRNTVNVVHLWLEQQRPQQERSPFRSRTTLPSRSLRCLFWSPGRRRPRVTKVSEAAALGGRQAPELVRGTLCWIAYLIELPSSTRLEELFRKGIVT